MFASLLCGNSACDAVGQFEGGEDQTPDILDMSKDENMHPFIDDMNTAHDMNTTPIDMTTQECDKDEDCAQPPPNTKASCEAQKCNYKCASTTHQVAPNQSIIKDGCTCEVKNEICDGEDNDCDGESDEELAQKCSNQNGVCFQAIKPCRGNPTEFNQECTPTDYNTHTPKYTEDKLESFQCDGLDNDCDNSSDEACCDRLLFPLTTANHVTNNIPTPASSVSINPTSTKIIYRTSKTGDGINISTIQREPASAESGLSGEHIASPQPCTNLTSIKSTILNSEGSTKLITATNCKKDNLNTNVLFTETTLTPFPNTTTSISSETQWNVNTIYVESTFFALKANPNKSKAIFAGWEKNETNAKLRWCTTDSPATDCTNKMNSPNIYAEDYTQLTSADINNQERSVISYTKMNRTDPFPESTIIIIEPNDSVSKS